jgi:2-isopropylmalate synthase
MLILDSLQMSQATQVLIYDTTLRDGTQGEGVSFSVTDKLRITEQLDQVGIDYIEGGWPGSNPRDVAFFSEARSLRLKHAKLCAFGSTRRANTPVEEDAQVRLLLEADTPVVTIFGKSWLLHVTEVLRTTPDENIAMIEDTVRHLVQAGREVVYDAEHFFDGYRADPAYALSTLDAAARGGAGCLTLCDTNGGQMVEEIEEVTKVVLNRFPGLRIGIHAHNDSGVGVAVSLASIKAGATLVQGTMNGFGERTGNANLTTIVPNLLLKYGRKANCARHLEGWRDLSLFIDELANRKPDGSAPYVGISAFAHKGGVHADAVRKVQHSYEHIDPRLVGNRSRVLVSDMAGRASLQMKAKELGIDLDPKRPEVKAALDSIKDLEFRGYEFEAADASLELFLLRALGKYTPVIGFEGYRVIVERRNGEAIAEATVKIRIGEVPMHTVAESSGPVGALDMALRQAVEKHYPEIAQVHLKDFKVRIVDSKQGAQERIRVLIESSDGKVIWGTVGVSDNIIEASWEALRDSLEYKLQRIARKS